jgi:hypothetical protein
MTLRSPTTDTGGGGTRYSSLAAPVWDGAERLPGGAGRAQQRRQRRPQVTPSDLSLCSAWQVEATHSQHMPCLRSPHCMCVWRVCVATS